MNTQTTRTQDLPGRPVRGKLDQETFVNARTTPWEPGANAGAPKVLVGLVGAALVGAVALAVVLMPAHKGVKHATGDQVAAAQVATMPASAADADTLAARMDNEPPAAGAPATAPPTTPSTTAATQPPAGTAPATTPAPADTTRSSATPREPVVAPPVLPQPESTGPTAPRTPASRAPAGGE